MLVAIRVYANYLQIQATIDATVIEREQQSEELAFTQNFLIHYEASDYARYFLQHENNMLAPWEYIIKFEENVRKVASWSAADAPEAKTTIANSTTNFIATPQASWKRFFQGKIK